MLQQSLIFFGIVLSAILNSKEYFYSILIFYVLCKWFFFKEKNPNKPVITLLHLLFKIIGYPFFLKL